jgi:hypothetical protein
MVGTLINGKLLCSALSAKLDLSQAAGLFQQAILQVLLISVKNCGSAAQEMTQRDS